MNLNGDPEAEKGNKNTECTNTSLMQYLNEFKQFHSSVLLAVYYCRALSTKATKFHNNGLLVKKAVFYDILKSKRIGNMVRLKSTGILIQAPLNANSPSSLCKLFCNPISTPALPLLCYVRINECHFYCH